MTCDPIEQTTALTDILLALVAFGGVFFLYFSDAPPALKWKIHIWSGAMGLIGLAALLGAVAHGLELRPGAHQRVWHVLNLALALAVSLFATGVAYDLWGSSMALQTLPVMIILGCVFYLVTLFLPGIFFLFILYEALALTSALCAYTYLAVQNALAGAGFMAAGILISIVAAILQTRNSVSITLIRKFDHNGIYHLVQIIGLLFLLAGIREGVVP